MDDSYKPPERFKLPHSLPLLASPDIKDSQIGGSYGTVSVVSYDYLTLLVTAKHAIIKTIEDFEKIGKNRPALYLPVLPGWRCDDIRKYSWHTISTEYDNDAYGKYDLAYAILTSDQTDAIDLDRIRVMDDSAKYLSQNVCGVLQGYPSRWNKNVRIRISGFASPTAVGFCTKLDAYPYQNPTHPDIFIFRYDRCTEVWNGRRFIGETENRPSMSGLSGGPVFCCMVNNESVASPSPVIGFLIEKNGYYARATSSHVLIDHLRQHHANELVSAQPHRDFNTERTHKGVK